MLVKLQRITEQILEELPHLHGIGFEMRKLADLQLASDILQPTFEITGHFFGDFVQVDGTKRLRLARDA